MGCGGKGYACPWFEFQKQSFPFSFQSFPLFLVNRGYKMDNTEKKNKISLSVEKYRVSERSEELKYFQTQEEKLHTFKQPCYVL